MVLPKGTMKARNGVLGISSFSNQNNIASWQFIQHVIAENKGGKVLKKVITLTQIYVCIVCFFF
jgi:hypothetical protein